MILNQEQLRLQLLREAPRGKWVALSSDETRIVAVADSFGAAAKEAKRLGHFAPVVWPIPKRWLAWSL
jgi:hypothetical protein